LKLNFYKKRVNSEILIKKFSLWNNLFYFYSSLNRNFKTPTSKKTNTMKTISLCVMFAFLFLGQTFAQYESPDAQQKEIKQPFCFIGTSVGSNNFNGLLGGYLEIHPAGKISLAGGIGIATWGFRFSGGLRYYKNFPRGFYYSGSLSYSTGLSGFETDMEDINGNTTTFNMELKPVSTCNLAIGYQFAFFDNRVRINFEGGYAIALSNDIYKINSGGQLSSTSEQAMNMISPGGLILSIGGSVGF
jgi:hypothetical protein